jgi:two-component system response regulator MprA
MAGSPQPSDPTPEHAQEQPQPQPARVLLVEDDTALARLMEALLISAGHSVQTVGDGESALDAIRDRRPALILLDLTIPKLNGWQVLERLQEAGDATPVILFTGNYAASQRAQSAGVAAAILKPFDVDELLATVEGLLQAGEGTALPDQ